MPKFVEEPNWNDTGARAPFPKISTEIYDIGKIIRLFKMLLRQLQYHYKLLKMELFASK